MASDDLAKVYSIRRRQVRSPLEKVSLLLTVLPGDFVELSPAALAGRASDAERFLEQLTNSRPLMVLCMLIEGERSVSVRKLNVQIPISLSALSRHLARLLEAGFVSTRREVQMVYCKLADQRVKTVIRPLYNMFCKP